MDFGKGVWIELGHYPYLVCSLVLFLVFCISFLCDAKHRRLLVYGGLGSCLYSLSSVVFVPEYWNPVRLACFIVGPEDLIFSFANGGLIWSLATGPFRRHFSCSFSGYAFVGRFLAYSMIGVVIACPGALLGMDSMVNCLMTMALTGLVLLALNRHYWRFSLVGGAAFLAIYAVVMVGVTLVYPHFIDQWSHDNLLGPTLFRLPIEEYAWALGFGAVFPLILAASTNVRILHQPA